MTESFLNVSVTNLALKNEPKRQKVVAEEIKQQSVPAGCRPAVGRCSYEHGPLQALAWWLHLQSASWNI